MPIGCESITTDVCLVSFPHAPCPLVCTPNRG